MSSSDQTGTEDSTDTSSGTDTFSGINEDGSDYSGTGSFSETALDSNSFTEHDSSNLTTGPSGLLNGTVSSSAYETHTWSDTRDDWDGVSTGGSDTDPITLTDDESGSTTDPVNDTTLYLTAVPATRADQRWTR